MHKTHHCGVERYISMNVYCTILFWVEEFSGFQCAKTSATNAFLYNISPLFTLSVAAFCLTSERDGKDVKKPLRLQRYNKKLTYANKNEKKEDKKCMPRINTRRIDAI